MAEDLDLKIDEVQRQIDKLQQQINVVESQLSKETDREERNYLRSKEGQLRKEKEQLRERQILLLKSRVPPVTALQAAPVDWASVLTLSSKQMTFLDDFLEPVYPLPSVHSGVTSVPVYGDVPSMLLFDLGRKDFTHAPLIEECVSSAVRKLQDTIVVAGTSGCGKTRSIYDLLAKEYGLYFVMSTELNGGSNDMFKAVDILRGFLTLNDRTGGNKEVVGVFVMLLLACRMVAFEYCRAKGVTTLQWLLLQVAGRGFRPGYDVLVDIFVGALRSLPLDREGIRSQHASLRAFMESKRQLFRIVALDEAQMAVTELAESYFPSESRKWVPLINPLVENLKRGGKIVLISGTGYTLYFKRDTLRASGQKMVAAAVNFVSFSRFQKPEEMASFAKKVVNLSPQELTLLESETWGIFPKFSGRFRPFSDVLQVMILKNMRLGVAAEYVIEGQTTRTGKPEFPNTFYMKVAELSARRMEGGISLINELKSAVVSYFGFGRGWTVAGWEDVVAVIEAGIGLMVTDNYAAEISEYLILQAARNFFEDEMVKLGRKKSEFLPSELFKRISEPPYTSAHQNFVAAKFEAMWKEYRGRMASMPLFKALLRASGCPAKFKKFAKLQGRLREGLWNIHVHSDRYPLLQYLSDVSQDRQLCTCYLCEDKFGAAAVRVAEFQENGETSLMHISDQYKLWKDPLSEAVMEDAVTKSGFVHEDVLNKLSTIRVQLVFICPQLRNPKWRWPVAFWEGDVGFVIVDNSNADQILGEEAVAFINILKDGMHLEDGHL